MGTAAFPDERRDEIERILDNLRRVVQVLYGHSRSVDREFRLTSPQAWLITTLSGVGPCRISDLARAMHLEHSTVVRIVGRLEGLGLVVRTVSSHGQGITLTHVGRKLASRIPPIPQERILKGLAEVPVSRLRAVSEGLDSLVRMLGASETSPRLFFAPVANLPAAGGSADRRWRESQFPAGDTPLGKSRRPAGSRTTNRGKGERS